MPPKTTSRFAKLDAKIALKAQCTVCRFLDAAPDVDADYIRGMIADGAASAHVARVLTEGGVPVTDSSVKRHRARHQ